MSRGLSDSASGAVAAARCCCTAEAAKMTAAVTPAAIAAASFTVPLRSGPSRRPHEDAGREPQ